MNEPQKLPVETDEWTALKAFTEARIALGKTGVSVPVRASLAFRLAHAHAKDAVYSALDTDALMQALAPLELPVYWLQSRAEHRDMYLQRPDYGRQLAPQSAEALREIAAQPADVAIVVADGLSATAVNLYAGTVVQGLVQASRDQGFTLAPLTLVEQGRVAIGDEIGHLLNARMVVMLIGERPGLSSADSLGAYLTFAPAPGLTDERRNCISNIRQQGLPPAMAVEKIMYLVSEAFRLKLTGVALKDTTDTPPILPAGPDAGQLS
ncbi:ethanolamine ammonia-lyase subunit EutC [Rudanella paleaurantiibacter]|uniref:Ethanolamine ammonia-lyase small subunit n=1 Tax=Rudanella paleaurantiibacter TaxID=2614655 RepID=A0A7J5TZS4_9BACT|nr:ethanolamine ammonia-lyase subunit EutC [Rudanella paleaurantiibacter]KAB7730869.1 ethanolamine ammonia-lyase subunit EutC [Rudanella paleaurantiibacter]